MFMVKLMQTIFFALTFSYLFLDTVLLLDRFCLHILFIKPL